jgi:hypothetical protein
MSEDPSGEPPVAVSRYPAHSVTRGSSGVLSWTPRSVSLGLRTQNQATTAEISAMAALLPKAAGRADVSKFEDLDHLFATVRSQRGQIDILFANAAFAEGGPLGAITEEHFDRHFDTNVKGLVFYRPEGPSADGRRERDRTDVFGVCLYG